MTLRIAHQLGAAEDAWLRSVLPGSARLVQLDDDAPWAVPPGTQVLLIGHGRLRSLHRDRPDWASSLRWVHVRPTGLDDAPDWLWRVPHLTVARGATAAGIAEYVLSAMLHVGRPIAPVRSAAGWTTPRIDGLEGRSLGLFGHGEIGRAIGARAQSFGMTVRATRHSGKSADDGTRIVPLAELCATSDHLVLCAPLTPATRNLFDDDVLAQCRPGQHLVNVARGALVVPDALRRALDGPISHATLDVWTEEPPPAGHWVYGHPKVSMTPHCSHLSAGTQARHREILKANLDAWLRDEPDSLFGRAEPSRGY